MLYSSLSFDFFYEAFINVLCVYYQVGKKAPERGPDWILYMKIHEFGTNCLQLVQRTLN